MASLAEALAGPAEEPYRSSGPEWLRRLGEMAHNMRGGGLAPDATTVAGFLPGAGFVQGNQDAGKARASFGRGEYGQAAVDMGNSVLNTASELPGLGGMAKLAMAVPAGIRSIAGLQGHLDDAFKGVSHYVGEGNNAVNVAKIVVPPEQRGQGIGTEFMKDVIEYGDRVGKPVALSPSDAFGGNKSKLMAWYKSLGFQPNTGRKADHSISESMVRPAQEPPKPPGIRAFHGSPLDAASGVASDSGMGIRAFHTTDEPFSEFDWERLGKVTAENAGGSSNEEWAMNLARLGPWAHEKPLTKQMGYGVALPVELGGESKHFDSLDELQAMIADAGGPKAFRQKLSRDGFGHISVNDEEFGGKSFVGLSPETFAVRGDK